MVYHRKYEYVFQQKNKYFLLRQDSVSDLYDSWKILQYGVYNNWYQFNTYGPDSFSIIHYRGESNKLILADYHFLFEFNFAFQDKNGKWNVMYTGGKNPVIDPANLDSKPQPYYPVIKESWFPGFSVLNKNGQYDLYNWNRKIILTGITELNYADSSTLFYGKTDKGRFVAYAGVEEENNVRYLSEKTQIEHRYLYAFLRENGKTGYYSYINRLYVPPIYDMMRFEHELLIAKRNEKYYFFDAEMIYH
jgi:hypothetical protein